MTTWTLKQKLEHLLTLPWTVQISTEDGELVARVAELPGVLATGESERVLAADLAESLEAVLDVMLSHNDPIMLPVGVLAPWEGGKAPHLPREVHHLQMNTEMFVAPRALSSASTSSLVHA